MANSRSNSTDLAPPKSSSGRRGARAASGRPAGEKAATAGAPKPAVAAQVGALPSTDITVVVLMGLSRRAALASRLVRSGWTRRMPEALVADASTPRQEVWRGTLGDLAAGLTEDPVRCDRILELVGRHPSAALDAELAEQCDVRRRPAETDAADPPPFPQHRHQTRPRSIEPILVLVRLSHRNAAGTSSSIGVVADPSTQFDVSTRSWLR